MFADMSGGTKFDVFRNQMVRNIDVMLEKNERLTPELNLRDPDKTCFVLLTQRIFKDNPRSRLYGRVYNEYIDEDSVMLSQDLPHRRKEELASVPSRLGWLTFEDCKSVLPGSCAWLPDRTSHSECH